MSLLICKHVLLSGGDGREALATAAEAQESHILSYFDNFLFFSLSNFFGKRLVQIN